MSGKHVHSPSCGHTPKYGISKKAFCKYIMPEINDKIKDGQVTYVHSTGLWFSATGKATLNEQIEIENKLFQVDRIRPTGDQYSAKFIGFKANPASPKVPEVKSEEESVLKVI
jgi:hypothetical protein